MRIFKSNWWIHQAILRQKITIFFALAIAASIQSLASSYNATFNIEHKRAPQPY